MKIAIFGGSFDPVHAEHVQIARAAREKLGADKVIVVPAGQPPHKKERHLAPAAARLEMARLAFAGIPGCEVSPFEINAGGTSYTVRTVRRFRERYPQDELYLLVGADMLRDFYTWKQPEEILSQAVLVACGREGDPADFSKEQKRFSARFGRRFLTLGYTGAAVSSTQVRVLCAFGEDVRSLVPAEVADYIDASELYRVGPVRAALGYLTPARRAHSLRVALLAAERAAELLRKTISDSFPRFRVETDTFRDRTPEGEMTFRNVWAVLPGKSREFLVIGAHYDAKKLEGVPEFQGANDGGSGVGVLLAMMKALSESGVRPGLELRFVFFGIKARSLPLFITAAVLKSFPLCKYG